MRRNRAGMTLVELMVVMAVVGLAAGLLLAAIGRARAAGLRAACDNNLRQLGVALTAYESAHGRLPPDGLYGWTFAVLPYLEQDAVARRFDYSRPPEDQRNATAAAARPAAFLCPSADGVAIVMPDLPPSHFGFNDYLGGRPLADAAGALLLAEGAAVPWVLAPRVGEVEPADRHGPARACFADGGVRPAAAARVNPDTD